VENAVFEKCVFLKLFLEDNRAGCSMNARSEYHAAGLACEKDSITPSLSVQNC